MANNTSGVETTIKQGTLAASSTPINTQVLTDGGLLIIAPTSDAGETLPSSAQAYALARGLKLTFNVAAAGDTNQVKEDLAKTLGELGNDWELDIVPATTENIAAPTITVDPSSQKITLNLASVDTNNQVSDIIALASAGDAKKYLTITKLEGVEDTDVVAVVSTSNYAFVGGTSANGYSKHELTPTAINSQADLVTYGFGDYAITNPMARAYKQAADVGVSDIKVVKLKGQTNEEKYLALHCIYAALEDFVPAKAIVVKGVCEGDTVSTDGSPVLINEETTLFDVPDFCAGSTQTFGGQLKGFVESISSKNSPVVGVMSTTPATSAAISDVKKYITTNTATPKIYSGFMQIVGGPKVIFGLGGTTYRDTIEAVYGAMMLTGQSYVGLTHKSIPGALGVEYALSSTQLALLTAANIVAPRFRNGVVSISDAITTAGESSDFTRLTTVLITADVIDVLRDIADPYIGQPNTTERRASLENALNQGLKAMKEKSALNDYKLTLQSTLADQIKGDILVFLDFVPAFEIRHIRIAVSLKAAI